MQSPGLFPVTTFRAEVVTPPSPGREEVTELTPPQTCHSLFSLLCHAPLPSFLPSTTEQGSPPSAWLRVLGMDGKEGGFCRNSTHMTYLEKDLGRVRNGSNVVWLIPDLWFPWHERIERVRGWGRTWGKQNSILFLILFPTILLTPTSPDFIFQRPQSLQGG